MISKISLLFEKDNQISKRKTRIIKTHCKVVKEIALELVKNYGIKNGVVLDKNLISLGAEIHDIGLTKVNNSKAIMHGEDGYNWLKKEGYPDKLARFCLSHVGVGISKKEAFLMKLDGSLDHMPNNIEEKIVAYADKFTSKGETKLYWNSVTSIGLRIRSYGSQQYKRWQEWKKEFGIPKGIEAKKIIKEFNES